MAANPADPDATTVSGPIAAPEKPGPAGGPVEGLPPAARRALDEAAARARLRDAAEPPVERGGRDGPDPARYGDWERKGIAIDF